MSKLIQELTPAELVLPTINLNGDTAETLVNRWHDAAEAIRVLSAELAKCHPHGRNYPGGDEDFYTASKHHWAAREALASIRTYVETIQESLADQEADLRRNYRSYRSVYPATSTKEA